MFSTFFLSLDQLVIENLGVVFVRMYVTLFLGKRSLLFSKTLQLVRACKPEKNVPSAFLIIFTVLGISAKKFQNWPFGPLE